MVFLVDFWMDERDLLDPDKRLGSKESYYAGF